MAWRDSDSGRQAVIWLATTVVISLGACATAFVIFFATENSHYSWVVWGSCFAAIGFFLFIINMNWERPTNQLKFWLSYQDRKNPEDEYSAARRRIRSREEYGTNQPPSVESVRDAANHSGAWVPRSSLKRRGRDKF